MSGAVLPRILTNGGRPRRQAAIAGAARIKEVHQKLQGESDEAHEDYNPPASEKEVEGTIICSTETAGFGTAKANVVRRGVAPLVLENDDENDELIASPDEFDDDNDEDFEIDRDDTEDEDDGVMDGDEGISEIEEMRQKEKRRTIFRKKGPSRERELGKNSVLLKRNALPARGVVGFRVTKVSQKVCVLNRNC